MTKFHFEEVLPYPAEQVFYTFRDQLEAYASLAPNVRSVKIMRRTEHSPKETEIEAQWQGSGDIPLMVRGILKPHMLSWRDVVVWNEEKLENKWVIHTFFFQDFVECKGGWKFRRVGENATRVRLEGSLHIFIPHLPPFPDHLVQKAGPIIERFILKYLEPNLRQSVDVLEQLLERELKEKGKKAVRKKNK